MTTTSTVNGQKLKAENKKRAQALPKPWRLYYYSTLSYFMTTVEPSYLVDECLKELLTALETAAEAKQPAREALEATPYQWARKKMRQLPMTPYTKKLPHYLGFINQYLVASYFFYSLYLFGYGLYNYGQVSLALTMPIEVSILGIIFQYLLILCAVFFFFNFIRQSACGYLWKRLRNIRELGAGLFFSLLALGLPVFLFHYRVFLIPIPVGVFWLALALYSLYRLALRYFNFGPVVDRVFDWHVKRQSEKKPLFKLKRPKKKGQGDE